MVRALLLTGAPGAGKSSVLEALSTRLEIAGIEHGAIESEELGRGVTDVIATDGRAPDDVAVEIQELMLHGGLI